MVAAAVEAPRRHDRAQRTNALPSREESPLRVDSLRSREPSRRSRCRSGARPPHRAPRRGSLDSRGDLWPHGWRFHGLVIARERSDRGGPVRRGCARGWPVGRAGASARRGDSRLGCAVPSPAPRPQWACARRRPRFRHGCDADRPVPTLGPSKLGTRARVRHHRAPPDAGVRREGILGR